MPEAPRRTYLHQANQILVAFDDSRYSGRALAYAIAVANSGGAKIALAHAIPPLARYFKEVLFPYAAMGVDEVEIEAELLDNAKARLGEAALKLVGADSKVEFETHVTTGASPATGLVQLVDQLDASIVFCGASGDTSPILGRIGATAQGIIANAHKPIFVVRDPAGTATVSRVLIALDGSSAAAETLNWGVSFALRFGADVELVTVIPDPNSSDTCGLLESLRLGADVKRKAERRARERAQRALDDLYVPFPFEAQAKALTFTHHTPIADPVEGICGCAAEQGADLIVVGSRHPEGTSSYLGRVAEGVVRRSGCNTLVIPILDVIKAQDSL